MSQSPPKNALDNIMCAVAKCLKMCGDDTDCVLSCINKTFVNFNKRHLGSDKQHCGNVHYVLQEDYDKEGKLISRKKIYDACYSRSSYFNNYDEDFFDDSDDSFPIRSSR